MTNNLVENIFSCPLLTRLSHWLWFGLFLSLTPILFHYWKLKGNGYTGQIPLSHYVVSHGELLLICMATLGGIIGELIVKELKFRVLRIWFIGTAFLLSLFCLYSYTEAISPGMDTAYIFDTSIKVLLGTVLLSSSALLLPKRG